MEYPEGLSTERRRWEGGKGGKRISGEAVCGMLVITGSKSYVVRQKVKTFTILVRFFRINRIETVFKREAKEQNHSFYMS